MVSVLGWKKIYRDVTRTGVLRKFDDLLDIVGRELARSAIADWEEERVCAHGGERPARISFVSWLESKVKNPEDEVVSMFAQFVDLYLDITQFHRAMHVGDNRVLEAYHMAWLPVMHAAKKSNYVHLIAHLHENNMEFSNRPK